MAMGRGRVLDARDFRVDAMLAIYVLLVLLMCGSFVGAFLLGSLAGMELAEGEFASAGGFAVAIAVLGTVTAALGWSLAAVCGFVN